MTDILEDRDGAVYTVTINRPPDNYFDAELICALADAYERLDAERRCRAIVLRTEGLNFCAGARLAGATTRWDSGDGVGPWSVYDHAIRLFAAATPVVAAVRGAAVGGGLGLAMSADFRVGTPETRMTANFARLGFHHGFALTVTLPGVIGMQRANDLLFTGRRITGEEAHSIGLLDRLTSTDSIDEAAQTFAAEIAASAPLAVASIRATMRGDLVERVRAAIAREASEQRRLMLTADFSEGVSAAASRRPPSFHGE